MKRRCEDCGRSFPGGRCTHYCPKCNLRRQKTAPYVPDSRDILKARIEVHRKNGEEAIAAALERQLEKETLPRRPGLGGARPAT